MSLYQARYGLSLRQRLEEFSDPRRRINAPKKPRRRRAAAPAVIPALEMRRVVTRFGILEMPMDVDPGDLTAEAILDDPRIRLVPDRDLTPQETKLVQRMSVEKLPKLNPRPSLSEAQLCFLQVVAELERQGAPFGWEEAYLHFATVRNITQETMRLVNSKRAGDSLLRKGLLMDGPRLTRRGKTRVKEHEEAVRIRRELGIKEYPLVRLEKHPQCRAYDEIYVLKDGKERCFFRHETRGFRCTRIVYVVER